MLFSRFIFILFIINVSHLRSQLDSNLIHHVNHLCDPLMQGRESGSWGQKLAGIYIQDFAQNPVIQTFGIRSVKEQSIIIGSKDTLRFAEDFFYSGFFDEQYCFENFDTLIFCKAEELFHLKTAYAKLDLAFVLEDWSNFLELFAHNYQTAYKELVTESTNHEPFQVFLNLAAFKSNDENLCLVKQQSIDTLFTENIIVPFIWSEKNEETILIAAHYDHLGIQNGVLFPGADDNASGVAIVLELLVNYQNKQLKDTTKNIVFAFFSGEEQGLFGSEHFVRSDLFSQLSIDFCINLDMVGFVALNQVYVIHYDPNGGLLTRNFAQPESLNLEHQAQENFLFEFSSDQISLFKRGIPSIMLFSGLHEFYHSSLDTPEKLNYERMTALKIWLNSLLE